MRRSLYLFAGLVALCGALIALASVYAPFRATAGAQTRDPAAVGRPWAAPRSPSDPILVELFTSQGCSSCPPADDVLARIATDPAIIAISRNVTYWDRLGWRDSLGREENTALQQRYAARGVDNGEVYTPEAVVNGNYGVVGSRESALRTAITRASAARRVALQVDGDRASTRAPMAGAELRFIAVAAQRSVAVGGGENGGRRLRYHNVVLSESTASCGATGPCAATIPAHIRAHSGADRWAVVLQRANGGPVLAARWMTPTG